MQMQVFWKIICELTRDTLEVELRNQDILPYKNYSYVFSFQH